jgi:hypothetical protein
MHSLRLFVRLLIVLQNMLLFPIVLARRGAGRSGIYFHRVLVIVRFRLDFHVVLRLSIID